jgi:hypothetical protein
VTSTPTARPLRVIAMDGRHLVTHGFGKSRHGEGEKDAGSHQEQHCIYTSASARDIPSIFIDQPT